MKQKPTLLCTSHGGDLYSLQDKMSRQLKRWVIRHCDALTVVSTPMVEKIRELGGEKTPPVSVIPMGTDIENTFVPNPAVKRLPNQLLFAGRLVEKKGVEYLLLALKEIRWTYPGMTLVIVGSGPLQKKLEALVNELDLCKNVIFKGRLEHQALVNFYQESTLAVFPFIQAADGDMEGLGLVMVEAMACGCPVVASDLPAVRDLILPETGCLATSADVGSLVSTILSVLSSRQFQTANPRLSKFGWQNVSKRYISAIKSTFHDGQTEDSATT